MRHMSNLHCPSCGHLIGTLTAELTDESPVSRWLRSSSWRGEQPSGELYEEFTNWARAAGISVVPTHKAWGQAMAAAGLRRRRGSKGVRLWAR